MTERYWVVVGGSMDGQQFVSAQHPAVANDIDGFWISPTIETRWLGSFTPPPIVPDLESPEFLKAQAEYEAYLAAKQKHDAALMSVAMMEEAGFKVTPAPEPDPVEPPSTEPVQPPVQKLDVWTDGMGPPNEPIGAVWDAERCGERSYWTYGGKDKCIEGLDPPAPLKGMTAIVELERPLGPFERANPSGKVTIDIEAMRADALAQIEAENLHRLAPLKVSAEKDVEFSQKLKEVDLLSRGRSPVGKDAELNFPVAYAIIRQAYPNLDIGNDAAVKAAITKEIGAWEAASKRNNAQLASICAWASAAKQAVKQAASAAEIEAALAKALAG